MNKEQIKALRLFDYLDKQVEFCPNEKALSYKEDGKWKHYSSQDIKRISDQYALALYRQGIRPKDNIAIIANNRPEWNFCDNGIQKVGAICVPIYPTSSLNDFEYILNNAEAKVVFVSDKSLFDKIKSIKSNIPSLSDIVTFDQVEGALHVSEYLKEANESDLPHLKVIQENIKTQDLATIIYTSGTTGNPKGVMLSHRNIIFNVEKVAEDIPLKSHHRTLSFLPLCHVFERVVTFYYFSIGSSVYFAESIDTLKDNINEVKPHFFSCVPRLMEKIHAGMMAKGQELNGIKKMIYYGAVALAHKKNAKSKFLYRFYDKMVYSKWREALGGELKGIVTGAAALQAKLDLFFNNIGIIVREGYGMTETAPVISYNRFGDGGFKNGTVGPILDGVTIKLDHRDGMAEDEGEILVKGENVMLGYYKNQEATNATFKEGWLCTGDVGKLIEGKFLKITDRVKELFKTSGGKYVAPQYIENKLKESKYIEQIIVIGNDRKFVSAIIYPNIASFKTWAGFKKIFIDFENPNWIKDQSVMMKIKKEIDRYNEQFSQIEKVKQYRLINEEWTIDKGELTPTLKLKRKYIEAKYEQLVEDIYKE